MLVTNTELLLHPGCLSGFTSLFSFLRKGFFFCAPVLEGSRKQMIMETQLSSTLFISLFPAFSSFSLLPMCLQASKLWKIQMRLWLVVTKERKYPPAHLQVHPVPTEPPTSLRHTWGTSGGGAHLDVPAGLRGSLSAVGDSVSVSALWCADKHRDGGRQCPAGRASEGHWSCSGAREKLPPSGSQDQGWKRPSRSSSPATQCCD